MLSEVSKGLKHRQLDRIALFSIDQGCPKFYGLDHISVILAFDGPIKAIFGSLTGLSWCYHIGKGKIRVLNSILLQTIA